MNGENTRVNSSVISRDGTSIAFERVGNGPAVILVDGALGYREQWGSRPLAAKLAKDFTVYTYDRRGRGESTDTQPYSVEREIEDLKALIDEAGGQAYLYGGSSGAVLALRAAAKLGPDKVAKLALYEPPFSVGEEARKEFARYSQVMTELIEEGSHGEAVAFFLGDMLPPEALEGMRQSPDWPQLEAVAPTLAYDNAVMGDGLVPVEDARSAKMPALILNGSETMDFLKEPIEVLAEAMPQAQRRTLEGLTHSAEPKVIGPVVAEFFNDLVEDTW